MKEKQKRNPPIFSSFRLHPSSLLFSGIADSQRLWLWLSLLRALLLLNHLRLRRWRRRIRDEHFERGIQRLADARDGDYLKLSTHVLRDFFQIALVARRQDDAANPCAIRRENLLLDSADGKDQTRQSNLARHRRVWTNPSSSVKRCQSGCDGHASRRRVPRNRARGHMQVNAVASEHLRVDTELRSVRPEIRTSSARRLLHHFAE